MAHRKRVDAFGPAAADILSAEQKQVAQELARGSDISIDEANMLVARAESLYDGPDALKQMEFMAKISNINATNAIRRATLVGIQISLFSLIAGVVLLGISADSLSEIFTEFGEMGVGSILVLLGLSLSIICGTFFINSANYGQKIDSSIDSAISGAASQAAEIQHELEDTPEDLNPIYISDRRHQW